MKKGLITLAVILALVMTMAIMAPAFAAKANDFDCIIASPKMKNVDIAWAGQTEDTVALFEQYNATISDPGDGTVKYEAKPGGGNMYLQLYPYGEDFNDVVAASYPYFAVSIKLTGVQDSCEVLLAEGGTPLETGEMAEFTKLVLPLTADNGLQFLQAGDQVVTTLKTSLKVVDYDNKSIDGAVAYVEYFGYFKSETDAKAFDYAAWLEANADNLKGDEAPESSAPESSTPEASTPESSKPSADTGHGTLVSGAVVLFAAAAAVVVLSKKR